MKKMHKRLSAAFLTAAMTLCSAAFVYAADISGLSAQEIVEDMQIGWNLGNSLDAHGGGSDPTSAETYWGNPKTTEAMIKAVKEKGFNAIRIPVTWYDKCDSNGKINANWMARVKEVVDYAYKNDMYVILNIHHEDSKIIPNEQNKASSKAWVINLWSQIAPAFKDYDRHLIFEAMNEPRLIGSGDEWTTGSEETRKVISELDQAALDTIRATGGNNSTRLVMCPSNAAKIPATTGFTLPDDENVVLSVHNYSPYEFAMNGYGTASWGSDSDKTALKSEIKELYNRYVSKGTPVIIGEMGATDKSNTAARAQWAEYYTQTAAEYGITCVVWDNNVVGSGAEHFGLLNRNNNSWYYSDVAEALVNGAKKAEKYEPSSPSSSYDTEVWEGSETISSYANFIAYDGILDIKSGDKIAVEYSGSDKPYLAIQNYKTGEWHQMLPDEVDDGVAYYSYDTIMSNCAGNYSGMNQTLIMAGGGTITVTKVSIVSPPAKGDVNLDGLIDVTDLNILISIILGKDRAENYGSRAFITDDDTVDVSDVNALVNIILNKVVE